MFEKGFEITPGMIRKKFSKSGFAGNFVQQLFIKQKEKTKLI